MTAARPIARLRRTSPLPFVARVPGSKANTNRALLLAALRPGTTAIANGLHADDPLRLAAALSQSGGLAAPRAPLDLGGGGTPARFLLAFAALAQGETVVTGDARLRQRPMGDLLCALRAIGVGVDCLGASDCLPAAVRGGAPLGTQWRVRADASSQFASAL